MATSVEGVWAIGDIRNTPFKQAVVAAGDGCIAAIWLSIDSSTLAKAAAPTGIIPDLGINWMS